MSTFNYDELRALAEELLAEFGKDAVLRKEGEPGGTSYYPTPGEVTDYPIKLLESNARMRDASGTLNGQVLKTFFVSTEGGQHPYKADKIEVDGQEYEIDDVLPLQPAETVLLFEVGVIA